MMRAGHALTGCYRNKDAAGARPAVSTNSYRVSPNGLGYFGFLLPPARAHAPASSHAFAPANLIRCSVAKSACQPVFSDVDCRATEILEGFRWWLRLLALRGCQAAQLSGVCAGCVMVAKSFVMVVLATLLGPAIGVGLFVLLHTM